MLYSVFEGILIKLFLFKLQCFWLAGPISWVTLQDHVFVANRETCFVSADGDPAGRMCRRSDSQHMSVLTQGGSNWGAGVHHEAARWLKLGWAELTATWTPCVPSSCVGGWVGGGLDLSIWVLGGSFVWQQRFASLLSSLRESLRRGGEESLAVWFWRFEF